MSGIRVGQPVLSAILILGGLCATASAATSAASTLGFRNPAAVYCSEVMGYRFSVVDSSGGELGMCEMPDGTVCAAWDFLDGTCGAEFSYCARHGYDLETRTDGKDPFSREYAVCVGPERLVIGSVVDLAGLSERSGACVEPTQLQAPQRNVPRSAKDADRAPGSFDWRSYLSSDWTTPVKNQANCGSCWAFSAIGVVEAAHNIAAGDPDLDWDLSEEHLVASCYTGGSCCGGWHAYTLQHIRDSGTPDEGCFGYSEDCSCPGGLCGGDCTYSSGSSCSDHTCSERCGNWADRVRMISSTGWVGSSSSVIKQAIVDNGPVAVAMGVGSGVGAYWDNGVYRCTNDSDVNHGVVIVGYDDAGGYWIVRNSWGSWWNGNGHFNVGYGECAIENYVYDGLAGQSTWAETLGGTSSDSFTFVDQTSDGGYVLAGYEASWGNGGNDAWVVKLDSTGTKTWSTTLGGSDDDYLYEVQQTSDGAYIAVGYEHSWGRGGADAWVVRLSSIGSTAWSKTFGGTGNDYFASVRETSDGGFIVAGRQASWGQGGTDAWVMKLDSTGNTVWSKTFGGAASDGFWSVRETADGGFVVAGFESSWGNGGSDAWAMKLSSTGSKIWSKTFGGAANDYFRSVRVGADGDLLCIGYEFSWGSGGFDGWAVGLDSDGNKSWSTTFGGTSDDYLLGGASTTDEGWLLQGYESSWGAGSYDGWIIKLDSDGNPSWSRTFGGTGGDGFWAGCQTTDGGYSVAGFESSWGSGENEAWILKLDGTGSR